MKTSQVVYRLPTLVAGLVCLAALLTAGGQTLAVFKTGGDAYRVGDWLINYSGGFVRRGFFGQIALLEGRLLPDTLLPFLLLIQLTLYGALLWFGFRLAQPHLAVRSTSIFLLLSPATFLFESLNPESFRKELLGLVLLAALCNRLRQSNSAEEHVVLRWLWGAAAALPLFVLSHEASVLFLPYIFLAVLSTGFRLSYRKPLNLNATALAVVVLSSRPRPRVVSSAGHIVLLVSALMYAVTWRVPISKPTLERGAIAQLHEMMN